jgi:molybdopterin converting factor subunit 1
MITVSIEYFAILREQRGVTKETLTVDVATAADLYEALRNQHGFSLPADRIRAAVNGSFVDAGHRLQSGDQVVFIPPVAGG